ncbi:MAG: Hpt domain-containing protein, partial [Polyangiales bacterium]
TETEMRDDPPDTAIVELVPGYLARRERDIQVLRAFVEGRSSFEDVTRVGHNLRGTASAYGFPRLGELGAALEDAPEALQVERVAWIADSMEKILVRARRRGGASEMKRTGPADARTVPFRHR